MKIKLVDNDVFDVETTFILDCTMDEFNNYLETVGCEKMSGECAGAVVEKPNDLDYVVYIKDSLSMSTIAHELFHLVVRICEKRGIPIIAELSNGSAGDETGAYLIDYYMRRVCNQ
jgi:hypothetical protein